MIEVLPGYLGGRGHRGGPKKKEGQGREETEEGRESRPNTKARAGRAEEHEEKIQERTQSATCTTAST